MRKLYLEVGSRTVEDTIAAWKGGADRVEMYVSPMEGALTPSAGFVQQAVAAKKALGSSLGLYAMIRPRNGDFLYSDYDFEIMKRDTEILYEAGAEGFIFGIVKEDGELDVPRMKQLVDLCHGRPITLHRAFESLKSPEKALEQAIDLGINFFFTGGPPPYGRWAGDAIPKLIEQAADRINIVIAIGPRFKNADIPWLVNSTGASHFHIINSYRTKPSSMKFVYGVKENDEDSLQKSLPTIEYLSEAAVREVRDGLDSL